MKRYLFLCQIIIQIFFKFPLAYLVAILLNEVQPQFIKQLDVGFALVNYFIALQYLKRKVLIGKVTEENIDFLTVFQVSFTVFIFQFLIGIVVEFIFLFS